MIRLSRSQETIPVPVRPKSSSKKVKTKQSNKKERSKTKKKSSAVKTTKNPAVNGLHQSGDTESFSELDKNGLSFTDSVSGELSVVQLEKQDEPRALQVERQTSTVKKETPTAEKKRTKTVTPKRSKKR